jgi:hypothetical protein
MLNNPHINSGSPFFHLAKQRSGNPQQYETEAFIFNNFGVIYGELLPQNRGQKITFATYAPCHPELADGCHGEKLYYARLSEGVE